jgi:hypothetical protein
MFHSEQPIKVIDEFASFRDEDAQYRATLPPPDDEPIKFRFHFKRGDFDKRMSGLELLQFVITHIFGVLAQGLLMDNQWVEAELHRIKNKILLTPTEALDEVLPWIQIEPENEEDTILTIDLKENRIYTKRPTFVY